jgi:SPP1 gp7 family putative phage head morphogenesis protein
VPSKPLEPTGIENRYAKLLLNSIRTINKIVKSNLDLPKLSAKLDSERLDDKLTDDLTAIFEFVWKLFQATVSPKGKQGKAGLLAYNKGVAKSISIQTNTFHDTQFSRTFRQITGVDPLKNEPWLKQTLDLFTEDNVNLIQKMQRGHLETIKSDVLSGFRKGESNAQIRASIKDTTGVTENRARLIARDQVAKLNAGLEQKRAVHNGLKKYIWHTNLDGRERPDHKKLDGKEFSWIKPPITVSTGKRSGERNHPGQDIQCRCWAENIYPKL